MRLPLHPSPPLPVSPPPTHPFLQISCAPSSSHPPLHTFPPPTFPPRPLQPTCSSRCSVPLHMTPFPLTPFPFTPFPLSPSPSHLPPSHPATHLLLQVPYACLPWPSPSSGSQHRQLVSHLLHLRHKQLTTAGTAPFYGLKPLLQLRYDVYAGLGGGKERCKCQA